MNQKFYNLFINNNSKNYEFYDLSGINISNDEHIVYTNSPDDKFFDLTNSPTNRLMPCKINFDNFKKHFDNGDLSFNLINEDFKRNVFNINDISYSLLCEIGNGKLINQDITTLKTEENGFYLVNPMSM